MPESGISEDICRCGHVASAHEAGEGRCRLCQADRRAAWSVMVRCHRFDWAARWETERTA